MVRNYTEIMNEIMTISPDGVQALMTEVANTTDIYDSSLGNVKSRPVPGYDNEFYIPNGENNDLPKQLKELIDGDEVTAQCLHFNVTAAYGAGVQWTTPPSEEQRAWMTRQSVETYLLEQATDLMLYYYTVSVIILSQDGKKINKLVHKESPLSLIHI